jgi:pimeloyl-ACP methyl ester carboxylesterase
VYSQATGEAIQTTNYSQSVSQSVQQPQPQPSKLTQHDVHDDDNKRNNRNNLHITYIQETEQSSIDEEAATKRAGAGGVTVTTMCMCGPASTACTGTRTCSAFENTTDTRPTTMRSRSRSNKRSRTVDTYTTFLTFWLASCVVLLSTGRYCHHHHDRAPLLLSVSSFTLTPSLPTLLTNNHNVLQQQSQCRRIKDVGQHRMRQRRGCGTAALADSATLTTLRGVTTTKAEVDVASMSANASHTNDNANHGHSQNGSSSSDNSNNNDTPVALKHLEFTVDADQGAVDSRHTHAHPPVIILHGLLGSKRNFATLGTSLAQQLRKPRRILALDLRNHGDNHDDWRTEMSYEQMVDDVIQFLDSNNLPQAVLVGHSMGGKVAQAMALLHPHRVSGLVVIDIAPVTYCPQKDGGWRAVCQILGALKDLVDLESLGLTTKRQLDTALRKAGVEDPALRAFVLTNVETVRGGKNGGGGGASSGAADDSLQWKIHLQSILRETETLAGFVNVNVNNNGDGSGSGDHDPSSSSSPPSSLQYHGDTFIISGGASRFIRVPHMETISSFFPNHMLTTVRGAGHWVHAEAPDDTLALLKRYLDR